MVFTDIPSQVNGDTIRVSSSWLNKLLDAVRRRTPIQGNGVRLVSTPNGTIISSTARGGGTGVKDEEEETENKPWDFRVIYSATSNPKTISLEVYLPQIVGTTDGSVTSGLGIVPVGLGQAADGGGIVFANPSVGDGWYRVASAAEDVWDNVINTHGRKYIRLEVYASYNGSSFHSYGIILLFGTGQWQLSSGLFPSGYRWELRNSYKIGYVTITEDGLVAVCTAKTSNFVANEITRLNATSVFMSPTDNTLVSNEIIALKAKMPSGGGAAAEVAGALDVPLEDSGTGSVGESTQAARADHQHPLQVDDDEPSVVKVFGMSDVASTTGTAGTSTGYARSDHEHGFPLIVANASNQDANVGVEFIAPDGMGDTATGEGGVTVYMGSLGSSVFAAALDHSHPLNVSDDPDYVADIKKLTTGATEGDYKECLGFADTYARTDHTHVILGVPWLANDPELPTGSVSGSDLRADGRTPADTPDAAGVGHIGDKKLSSPIDHSHPLNLVDASPVLGSTEATPTPIGKIKPSENEAKFGTSWYYCRQDHVHPLPTAGVGATAIKGVDAPQTGALYFGTNPALPTNFPSSYTGSTLEWNRDGDYTGANHKTTSGVSISVVTKIMYNNTQSQPRCFVAFLRTLQFDASGALRSVSAAHGVLSGPAY